jgi:hypothetical protein
MSVLCLRKGQSVLQCGISQWKTYQISPISVEIQRLDGDLALLMKFNIRECARLCISGFAGFCPSSALSHRHGKKPGQLCHPGHIFLKLRRF